MTHSNLTNVLPILLLLLLMTAGGGQGADIVAIPCTGFPFPTAEVYSPPEHDTTYLLLDCATRITVQVDKCLRNITINVVGGRVFPHVILDASCMVVDPFEWTTSDVHIAVRSVVVPRSERAAHRLVSIFSVSNVSVRITNSTLFQYVSYQSSFGTQYDLGCGSLVHVDGDDLIGNISIAVEDSVIDVLCGYRCAAFWFRTPTLRGVEIDLLRGTQVSLHTVEEGSLGFNLYVARLYIVSKELSNMDFRILGAELSLNTTPAYTTTAAPSPVPPYQRIVILFIESYFDKTTVVDNVTVRLEQYNVTMDGPADQAAAFYIQRIYNVRRTLISVKYVQAFLTVRGFVLVDSANAAACAVRMDNILSSIEASNITLEHVKLNIRVLSPSNGSPARESNATSLVRQSSSMIVLTIVPSHNVAVWVAACQLDVVTQKAFQLLTLFDGSVSIPGFSVVSLIASMLEIYHGSAATSSATISHSHVHVVGAREAIVVGGLPQANLIVVSSIAWFECTGRRLSVLVEGCTLSAVAMATAPSSPAQPSGLWDIVTPVGVGQVSSLGVDIYPFVKPLWEQLQGTLNIEMTESSTIRVASAVVTIRPPPTISSKQAVLTSASRVPIHCALFVKCAMRTNTVVRIENVTLVQGDSTVDPLPSPSSGVSITPPWTSTVWAFLSGAELHQSSFFLQGVRGVEASPSSSSVGRLLVVGGASVAVNSTTFSVRDMSMVATPAPNLVSGAEMYAVSSTAVATLSPGSLEFTNGAQLFILSNVHLSGFSHMFEGVAVPPPASNASSTLLATVAGFDNRSRVVWASCGSMTWSGSPFRAQDVAPNLTSEVVRAVLAVQDEKDECLSLATAAPPPSVNNHSSSAGASGQRVHRAASATLTATAFATLMVPSMSLRGGLPPIQGLLASLRLSARCAAAEAQTNGGAGDSFDTGEPPLSSDAGENPLQLSITLGNAHDLAFAVGALVGNTIAVAAVGLLSHACSVLWQRCTPAKPSAAAASSSPCPRFCRLLETLVSFVPTIPVPGSFLLLVPFLLEPTVAAAVSSMAHPVRSASTVAVGVVVMCLWLGILLWLLWTVCFRWRPFPFETVPLAAACGPSSRSSARMQRRRRRNGPFWSIQCLMQFLCWLCQPIARWKPNGSFRKTRTTATAAPLCSNLFNAFEAYHGNRRWFFAVECGLAVATGVVVGVAQASGPEDACSASVWGPAVLCSLAAVEVLLCATMRPNLVRLDTIITEIVAGLSIIAEMIILVDSSSDSSQDAALGVALAAAVIELVAVVTPVVLEALLAHRGASTRLFYSFHAKVCALNAQENNTSRGTEEAQRRRRHKDEAPEHRRLQVASGHTHTTDSARLPSSRLHHHDTVLTSEQLSSILGRASSPQASRNALLLDLVKLACNQRFVGKAWKK